MEDIVVLKVPTCNKCPVVNQTCLYSVLYGGLLENTSTVSLKKVVFDWYSLVHGLPWILVKVELIQGRIRGRDKWAKPPPLKKSLLWFPRVIKRSLGLNPSGKPWLTPPPGQIPVYATELIHGRVCLKRQRFSVPSRLQNTDSAFFLQGGQKHFYKKSWIY